MRWIFALLLMTGIAFAQSQPNSPTQPPSKGSPLGEQNAAPQPTPPANFLTPEQITKAITDGVNAATKQYETRHPSSPPDNSGWWFNFLLVTFTGGLVVVGAGQCYLIFWTLQATQTAANAAIKAAEAITVVERAYVYPVVIAPGAIAQCIQAALDSEDDDVPAPVTAELTFKFRNFGKTPAILKDAFVGYGAAPVGALMGVSLPESVLASLEETSPITSEMQVGITRKQAQHILAYTAHICFEGHVTFDDIWGNEHTTKFYFVWDKEIKRMALRWTETKTKQKGEHP